jgi:cyclophilin family peptidyl-prolyl cis-trans isomerase
MLPRLLLLACLLLALAPRAHGNIVVVVPIVMGPPENQLELELELELFDAVTPLTTANFLFYVDANAYDQSFIHRSVPDFVIQGGGYKVNASQQVVLVATNPPQVTNEPGLSNVRGTVAMAKLAGQPNSATTQWFINLDDNSFLDTTNGGFTVFADVISGLEHADAINALTIVNAGSPFGELPVFGWTAPNPVVVSNLVRFPDVARQTAPQCGDLDADADIDRADVTRLRNHLANPLGSPLAAAETARCSVIGTAGDCNLADATVLRRRLAGRVPIRAQLCPAAG